MYIWKRKREIENKGEGDKGERTRGNSGNSEKWRHVKKKKDRMSNSEGVVARRGKQEE